MLVSDALVPPMINLLSENSLLTEEVPSSERLQKTLDFLRSKNFEVEVVPHGFGYISRGKKVWSKDIDYNLNVEPGTKTLVVEPEYYNSNKARLNEIASKWGLKIESHEKADPNFLVLEPGKVVVSKDSKETINALRNRGVNVVVGPSFKHNKALGEHGVSGEREALGGGIRCATNVLSPGIRLIAPKKMSLQVFNPIF